MTLPSTRQQSQDPNDSGADLYRDDRISVTPSWLSIDNARYSIRTVVRLEYETLRPKLGIAYFFFFGAIILMAYSLYQFTKPSLHAWVPWIMLIGSVIIFLYAASMAFQSKTRYQIMVTLLDGAKVPIITGDGKQAQGVLDSLTLAMDWHRNSDIVIEAERSSHVRQAHASSSKGVTPEERSGTAQSNSATVDPAEHPSRVVRKLSPIIAAMLKRRD